MQWVEYIRDMPLWRSGDDTLDDLETILTEPLPPTCAPAGRDDSEDSSLPLSRQAPGGDPGVQTGALYTPVASPMRSIADGCAATTPSISSAGSSVSSSSRAPAGAADATPAPTWASRLLASTSQAAQEGYGAMQTLPGQVAAFCADPIRAGVVGAALGGAMAGPLGLGLGVKGAGVLVATCGLSAAACQRIGGASPAGEQASSDHRPQARSSKEVLLTAQRQRSAEKVTLGGGVEDVATPGGKDAMART